MSDDESGPEGRIELRLYVRSMAPHQARHCQERLVEKLFSIGSDSPRVETDVELWGPEMDVSGPEIRTTQGRHVHETVDRIRAWADRHDIELEPFFRERTISPMVGDSYTEVRFPNYCLVVSKDDEILEILPCIADGEPYSVPEYLDRFLPAEADDAQTGESPPEHEPLMSRRSSE